MDAPEPPDMQSQPTSCAPSPALTKLVSFSTPTKGAKPPTPGVIAVRYFFFLTQVPQLLPELRKTHPAMESAQASKERVDSFHLHFAKQNHSVKAGVEAGGCPLSLEVLEIR